ncbi:unnamed protein product [Callosobruchus maculatus]|uniref:DUF2452 domain-containing protein n=1 Tax=Callosobruchus maculatus TaxID=64391 RepID=A0A653DX91_CALMS|nr:unnamed protein product [Callosobruchus maculatus]
MKRCTSDNSPDAYEQPHKVAMVERNPEPSGVALVNPIRVSKKGYTDLMELDDGLAQADTFARANAKNKLEVIGRQMKNLQELMNDVINETKLNSELNSAACNFVKKPGHIYHLYQRPSGQKYFGMLSPEEWTNAPHTHLGSYRLEADYSWTPAGSEETRFEGLNFLKDVMTNPRMKAIMSMDIS